MTRLWKNRKKFPPFTVDNSDVMFNPDFMRPARLFVLVTTLLLFLSGAVKSSPAAAARPDILILMPDQMRGDCLSILGHPVVQTPNLDKLAREGALFRRGYSTCPSCIPARASLLTGLYPQTSGVVGFKARPITAPTMPKILADAGYTTILVGRYMHQVPAEDFYGFQKEIRGSTYLSDDDYDNYLKTAAPESGGIRKLVETTGVTMNWWQAKPWPLADDLHPTSWIVRQGRKVLTEAPADRPLFFTASFFAPHSPLFPPKEFFDACLASNLPAPAHGDWVKWSELKPEGNKAGDRVLLEGKKLREAQAGYFGLIDHLDEQLGFLIADFQKRSEKARRAWVIILISDHGEMLADNGYYRKCEPFEGSANIPFVIAGSPELGFKPGLRTKQPVCLEDIMPTVLDLAGAPIPKPMDGISLTPFLRGKTQTVRDWLHFEHAPCYNQEQAFQALTDGHIKYIWRPLDGTEYLFDLEKDPHEERDLSKVAAQNALLKQTRARLVRQLAGRPEGFSDGTNLIPGRPYPPLQAGKGAESKKQNERE